MKRFEKILLATDFSDYSEVACEYALSLAQTFNSSLLVLHVINEPVDLRGFMCPISPLNSWKRRLKPEQPRCLTVSARRTSRSSVILKHWWLLVCRMKK